MSYSGNQSFSDFQDLMESVQRLGERPDAWPSTLALLNPIKLRPQELYQHSDNMNTCTMKPFHFLNTIKHLGFHCTHFSGYSIHQQLSE